jgi:hypothetical protein
MAYPRRIYDLVCEDEERWSPHQWNIFDMYIWFSEAFGFAFEKHRYNHADSLMNQTWYGSTSTILVFPHPTNPDILYFKRFVGTISGGDDLHAPDMLFSMVRECFHI